jgi:hypothetical protein
VCLGGAQAAIPLLASCRGQRAIGFNLGPEAVALAVADLVDAGEQRVVRLA